MIMLRTFSGITIIYERTHNRRTDCVKIALNCMVACLAHVSFSFIFSLHRKTLRVTISFQLNIWLCLCVN